jgi:hypothetical protein
MSENAVTNLCAVIVVVILTHYITFMVLGRP